MIAEIICVGTELLLGETINTNSSYIAKKLSILGIDCYYQTNIGDNSDRIKKVLDIALERSDLIIFTGGLGPTDDDITIQSISEFFNHDLILDNETLFKIENFFKKLKREMPSSNKKQAYIPKGAKIIPNSKGTAPGIVWELQWKNNSKKILTFPGVPEELYSMWEETAHKYLEQYSNEVLITRHLKYMGISEAALADKVKDLLTNENPTVAPLLSKGEATLRIAAKAKNIEKANSLIDEMEKTILLRTSQYFYGYDSETLDEIVGELLLDKNLTLAVAESCTGGLFSSKLTDISGSSEYTKLNFVTYSNEAKIKALGINEKVINYYGAVSKQTALYMSEGVRLQSNCKIGIAITGIAGPTGGSDEKPVGLIYIAISNKYNDEVHELRLPDFLSRKQIKEKTCQHALNLLRLFILKYY